jgi:DNA-binding transcriptional MerR regulator
LTEAGTRSTIISNVQSPAADASTLTAVSEIPNKLYFRIGDVAKLAGIKPHVLRYWETEFPAIAPKKSGTGHRLYRRKDVELILEIKHLLYEKRYTIEGARKAIAQRPKAAAPKSAPNLVQADLFAAPTPDLRFIRDELMSILQILGRK